MASKSHVFMFPWLAYGHILPYLEFSKQLAAKGIHISFISTPRNIKRFPSIPQNISGKFKFIEIQLPIVDGLPENCEATIDLSPEQIQYLKQAYDALKVPFESLVQKEAPEMILFDFAACWIPAIAARYGITSVFFSPLSAASSAYLGPPDELRSFRLRTRPEDYARAPEWIPFPSLVAYRPDQGTRFMQHVSIPDVSGISTGQRRSKTLAECDLVALRSCREFEDAYLNVLEEIYQKPVLPIGLLPPNFVENKTSHPESSNFSSTFKWLDKQEQKSVVFVGFGSEYKMPVETIHELAYGIELSGLPFMWILNKPEGIDSQDLLPTGFISRISDRGIVNFGWAPQLEILAHPSIGGCLFHSGWGSIIESLGFGHPLILMPMVNDQTLNAKLQVEKSAGFEVPRNKDGSFNRDMVAKSMRLVMVDEEGEPVRLKTSELQAIFASQHLQDEYISKFIRYTSSFKKKEH